VYNVTRGIYEFLWMSVTTFLLIYIYIYTRIHVRIVYGVVYVVRSTLSHSHIYDSLMLTRNNTRVYITYYLVGILVNPTCVGMEYILQCARHTERAALSRLHYTYVRLLCADCANRRVKTVCIYIFFCYKNKIELFTRRKKILNIPVRYIHVCVLCDF